MNNELAERAKAFALKSPVVIHDRTVRISPLLVEFTESETAELRAENERLRGSFKSLGIDLGKDGRPRAWDYDKCNSYKESQTLRHVLTELVEALDRPDTWGHKSGNVRCAKELTAAKALLDER